MSDTYFKDLELVTFVLNSSRLLFAIMKRKWVIEDNWVFQRFMRKVRESSLEIVSITLQSDDKPVTTVSKQGPSIACHLA